MHIPIAIHTCIAMHNYLYLYLNETEGYFVSAGHTHGWPATRSFFIRFYTEAAICWRSWSVVRQRVNIVIKPRLFINLAVPSLACWHYW